MQGKVATEIPGDLPEKAQVEEDTEEFRAQEEQRENTNFFMLLHELHLAEKKGVPLSELEAIDARVKAKVDGIFARMTKLEAEAVRLGAIQAEYGKAKAAIQAKQERLKEWAKYCMTHFGRDLLNGEKFTFQIQEQVGGCEVAPAFETPTAIEAMLYPEFVTTTRSWKRAEGIKALKAGVTEGLPPYFSLGKIRKFIPKIRRKEK
jgi:hypothetical protein